jgi:hypothetical protein
MNGHEGLSRIARVIAGIGWIWGALLALGALSSYSNGRHEFAMLCIIFGVIGLAGAKGLAWIIQGFARPHR